MAPPMSLPAKSNIKVIAPQIMHIQTTISMPLQMAAIVTMKLTLRVVMGCRPINILMQV